MSSATWTDLLGRTYAYEPYEAEPVADLEVSLTSSSTLAVAAASSAIGSIPPLPLAGAAAVMFRSEASASSIIEDLAVSPRRILEAEAAGAAELSDPVAERIVGNLEGLRDAMATPYPAGVEDVLRWHHILLEGHPRMRPADVGHFRAKQNWIGGDSSGPRNAEFIPPPPEDVELLMADLVDYLHRDDVAPVVHASIAHARFEVIHPFTDGNGRVGRMLLQHVLAHRAGAPVPIPVSVPWSRDKARYIDGLRRYQASDLDPWIEFAATTMVEAVAWMTSAHDRVTRMMEDLRSRSSSYAGSTASRIIDDLVEHPLVDTPTVTERYGVSRQAANEALRRLAEADILTERSFSRRTRGRPRKMYGSKELLDLLGAIVTD